MRLWEWFCKLGEKRQMQEASFWQTREKGKQKQASGVEVCTRLCGHAGCRCGGTMRGLYCVWSYYRE